MKTEKQVESDKICIKILKALNEKKLMSFGKTLQILRKWNSSKRYAEISAYHTS